MTVTSFASVPAMFLNRIQSTPDAEAFYYPDETDNWQTMLWKEVGERVAAIAGGLRTLNINIEDRCAILSNTKIEWILIDLGILNAGGATTTIYPTNTAEECQFIINDSATKIVFAENEEQAKKIMTIREQTPSLEKIIILEGKYREEGFVIGLNDLEAMGREWLEKNKQLYLDRINEIQPHHLCTLIYTSGTTGRPKGVELLHDCWVFEAEAMDNMGFLTPADKQFLWLPLSHSFGKVLEAAIIRIGIPTAIDGRLDRIVPNLAEIQPTFVAAVPRIFEKLYNRIVSDSRSGGDKSLKYKIFRWALNIGQEVSTLRQSGLEPQRLLRLKYAVADMLVFSKIKNKLGGNLQFFISGSAPLSYDIATFFHAAGIKILEGYGLTESSAASFVNRPDAFKFGTVGKALPGVEYKLDPNDSEILLKGRGIMRGYHNLETVTEETLNDEWLRTGDIGQVDADGYLKIVDRKKDLIKTSGGKYVAPQKLENKIKSLCPYVSQAIVHGNARNYCTMLITLDEDEILKWAEEAGLENLTYTDLTQHDDVRRVIEPYINLLNKPLSPYETIKKFAILPIDFTVETGEMTPSMKIKRKVVENKYKDILNSFYETSLQKM